MYKTIIIDDEALARQRIRQLCTDHTQAIEIIGEADCGSEAIRLITELNPDLLLLDIQMPDMSGLEVLQQIDHDVMVIFTTAHTEYAIQAFDSLAVDYLVKPISVDRFSKAMDKLHVLKSLQKHTVDINALQELISQSQKKNKTYSVSIKKNERIYFVDYSDIVYLKAQDKYVTLFDKNGKEHISDKSLQEFEAALPEEFIRISRSSIIHRHCIASVEKYFKGTLIIHLLTGQSFKTGETYSKHVKSILNI